MIFFNQCSDIGVNWESLPSLKHFRYYDKISNNTLYLVEALNDRTRDLLNDGENTVQLLLTLDITYSNCDWHRDKHLNQVQDSAA